MSGNTEELGIRLSAQGVPETTTGINLTGKAVEDYGKKADAANRPIAANSTGLLNQAKSAKEVQAAFRLLPAQITDVVTSLASGQPAWLVAIQQGGQIKDSFGGIGPAFQNIVAAIGPMRLALMGVAGVSGLVVLAHQAAGREAHEYTRALIANANAAGTNADQMALMARAIAQSVGTTGAAAEAVAAMAATGEVGHVNLQRFAELALRMERTLDRPLSDTADKFTELGRAPLEATLKLNRGVNYLTASLYDQIRALMAEGREAEAAAVAQTAYADAMESRTAKAAEQLDGLAWIWRGLTDWAKGYGDAVKDIFRQDTITDQIKAIDKQLSDFEAARQQKGGYRFYGLAAQAQARDEEALRQQRAALNRTLMNQTERAAADAAAVLEEKQKLQQREASMIEAGNAVALAQARAAATEREGLVARDLAVAEAAAERRENLVRREQATLEDLRGRDSVSQADYYTRRAALEAKALSAQLSVVDSQVAAGQKLVAARLTVIDAEMAAEQRRKPVDEQGAQQQEARLIELRARRGEVEAQQEVRIIELKSQRAGITAQLSAAEVAAARAVDTASAAAEERFIQDIGRRRQSLSQFNEQLRSGNERAAVDLISDPFTRATAQAQLEIRELARVYDEQVGGLKARMAALEIVQPDAAENVRAEILQAEQRKADAIVLINRRLTEQLKPQWQQMLEGWQDTTRLMREAYDDFQTGWLREGESAWAEYAKTGKLNIRSLADFALAEMGKAQFKQFIAPEFAKAGEGLAGLLGIAKPAESIAQTAAITNETAARVTQTAALTMGNTALSNLATQASYAAAALASMSSAGGGGGALSLAAGILGAIAGGNSAFSTVDTGGYGMTSGGQVLPTRGGLASGGTAMRGSMYEVNEEGPELLTVRNRTYLMMGGNDGYVTPHGGGRSSAQSAGSSGGLVVHFAPQIQIDARSDQAQVMQMVQGGMQQAQAELLDMLERRQA